MAQFPADEHGGVHVQRLDLPGRDGLCPDHDRFVATFERSAEETPVIELQQAVLGELQRLGLGGRRRPDPHDGLGLLPLAGPHEIVLPEDPSHGPEGGDGRKARQHGRRGRPLRRIRKVDAERAAEEPGASLGLVEDPVGLPDLEMLDDEMAACEFSSGGRSKLLRQLLRGAAHHGRFVRQHLGEFGGVLEREVHDLARSLSDVVAELGRQRDRFAMGGLLRAPAVRVDAGLERDPIRGVETAEGDFPCEGARQRGNRLLPVVQRVEDLVDRKFGVVEHDGVRVMRRRAGLHGSRALDRERSAAFAAALEPAAEILVGLVAASALRTLELEVAHAHPASSTGNDRPIIQ